MNRRLVVLLLVLVAVWSVAIYVLFLYQKSPTAAPATRTSEAVIQPLIRRLNDPDIERFRTIVGTSKPIENVFEPYVLKLNRDRLMRQALSELEVLPSYKFRGYFVGENEDFVMFSSGIVRPVGSILENRYLIVHVVSFAAIVMDLSTGNLLVVK
ncbi:hypothetical protein AS159_07445 [Thermotoga sp. Ku-13t]|uniref:hypothetical protein n=1 Tax=Thermotoga sp. Ku-13t TaxID=1755813 RepID=UPI0013E9F6D1|nr:hypothetical protein [Thermotoga sp. Ku-13t]KAF2957494.1 hypothetical protein AS159_07445 [Thermotoga sp. Ku-13t]